MDITALHSKLADFLDDAQTRVFVETGKTPAGDPTRTSNFAVTQFAFDTLILVSEDPSLPHSDANFIFACIQIIKSAASIGLPLRGAIGLGNVLTDVNRGILLSSEFASLARIEKSQEWMGCGVTDSAAERLFGPLFGNTDADLNPHAPLVKYPVPLKEGSSSRVNYALNWITTFAPRTVEQIVNSLPDQKRINSLAFIRSIVDQPGFAVSVPPEAKPVCYFQYLSCRLKLEFFFLDQDHQPVDPVSPFTISISDGKVTHQMMFSAQGAVPLT
jgi:hypothetical protein